MLMHGLDDLGCRDRPCARETLQKRCQAKEMIAVPVGDVNGVALTADECRRICHPHQFFLAGRQIANEARTLYREYIPLKISFRIHCRVLFWLSDIRNIGVGLGGSAVDRDLGHASCTGIEQMLTKPFCCGGYRERKLVEIGSEVSA